MIVKASPDSVKRKTVRYPTWSETGYILQGCGIGILIGQIFSDVHLSNGICSALFFGLIVIGGYMNNSSKR
jgi:hypothetical protein